MFLVGGRVSFWAALRSKARVFFIPLPRAVAHETQILKSYSCSFYQSEGTFTRVFAVYIG